MKELIRRLKVMLRFAFPRQNKRKVTTERDAIQGEKK